MLSSRPWLLAPAHYKTPARLIEWHQAQVRHARGRRPLAPLAPAPVPPNQARDRPSRTRLGASRLWSLLLHPVRPTEQRARCRSTLLHEPSRQDRERYRHGRHAPRPLSPLPPTAPSTGARVPEALTPWRLVFVPSRFPRVPTAPLQLRRTHFAADEQREDDGGQRGGQPDQHVPQVAAILGSVCGWDSRAPGHVC